MEEKHVVLLAKICAELDGRYYYHPASWESEELRWLQAQGYIRLEVDDEGYQYATPAPPKDED